jgi:acyl-phosphate glycerol 3-phosphate acyltransferase
MTTFLLLGASYLIGAVPFGYLVARARGVDLLRQGSGNIGATNVARVLGLRWGIVVFFLDFAKGALPVLLAQQLPRAGEGLPPQSLPVGAGVAALLGHLFPIYLRFRGGKGVATASGVLAVLLPLPFLAAFLCWLSVFVSTRIMSLASLLAAGVLSALRLAFTPHAFGNQEAVVSGFCVVAAALVVARHHANIRRLLQGTENRFADTSTMDLLNKTLHVFAVALWFGTLVFFTLMGALLFPTFDALTALPAEQRPVWLPVPAAYEKARPSDAFPDPLRREQGSRIAGTVVGPLFPWYFGIQAVCGLVAIVTAAAFLGRGFRKGSRARIVVVAGALACVGFGWWLDHEVQQLRIPRNELSDAVLSSSATDPELLARAEAARQAFARWHGYSLIANFSTLLFVTIATVLAAQLPSPPSVEVPVRKTME